jgi:hypothetical protein
MNSIEWLSDYHDYPQCLACLQDGTVYQLRPVVEGSQEVEIYDPVSVLPKLVVLPWDPLAKSIYNYQLKVSLLQSTIS